MFENQKMEKQFKSLLIIYFALGAGVIVFPVVILGLDLSTVNPELAMIYQIIVPVVGVSTYLVGRVLYQTNAKKSKEEQSLDKKFMIYQSSCLIVWAMSEGSAIFACIAYLQTGEQLFLALYAIIFLGYLYAKPTIAKFEQDF